MAQIQNLLVVPEQGVQVACVALQTLGDFSEFKRWYHKLYEVVVDPEARIKL